MTVYQLSQCYDDLVELLKETMRKLECSNPTLDELEMVHQVIYRQFTNVQFVTDELAKQKYVVKQNEFNQILVELEYMTNKFIHKDSYKDKELVASYKQLINTISSKLSLSDLVSPPRRNTEPFLVKLWTSVLQLLEKLSVFYVIRTYIAPEKTKGNHRFVDIWLLVHTALAVIYVVIAGIEQVPSWLKYMFLVYSCLRMFEILIYQLNVILVHPYNTKNYSLNSYRRMTIALLHNFFEIIFWFAGTFITLQFISDVTVPLAVYTSFTHMVTYSMELEESKWSVFAILILLFQAIIGVFMTVLSLARFISLFPQPMSMDPAEQEANQERHKHLMHKLIELEMQVKTNKNSIQELEKEEAINR